MQCRQELKQLGCQEFLANIETVSNGDDRPGERVCHSFIVRASTAAAATMDCNGHTRRSHFDHLASTATETAAADTATASGRGLSPR